MPELSQEELEQIQKDLSITKFQLQEIKDILEGQVRSANIVEYRNTYSEYDWGNCDTTYDFIMDFTLIDEMTKLVSCKVSFRIRPFSIGVKDI